MTLSKTTQKLILLIDDDVKFSIGIVALLRREGYLVCSSRNGKEGLELIRTQKPDLVLCDLMMPPPDGLQVKLELNQDDDLRSIPFLFISAMTALAEINKALELGAVGYVIKPFDVEELIDKVNGILRTN